MLHENIWILVGVAAAGWLPVYALLLHARLRIYWDKHWRGSLLVPPLVSVSYWLLRFLPYTVILSFFIFRDAQHRADRIPLFSFLAVAFLFSGAEAILTWHSHRIERRLAGRIEKQYVGVGVKNHGAGSSIVFLGFLLLWIFPFGFILLLGYVVWRAVQWRKAGTTAGKGSFKLEEDVPLHSEILRLARTVGKVPKSIFVRARSLKGGLRNVPLLELSEGGRASIANPVFPVENFIYLNPGAFTAALALRWAGGVKPNSAYVEFGGAAGLMSATLAIVIGLVAMVISLGILNQFVGRYDFPGVMGSLAIAAGSIVAILRAFGLIRTQYEALRDGLLIWSAPMEADRNIVQDYMNALAEHHSFTMAISDAELVAHRFRLDRRIRKLLRAYNMDIESALDAVRKHLEKDPVYPTAQERAIGATQALPTEIHTPE